MERIEEQDLEFLRRLVGLELSAVIFIRDYLQLQLEGASVAGYPILTIVTSPQLDWEGTTYTWNSAGFRDAICGQISRVITSVVYGPDKCVSIGFETGGVLRISLVPELPTSAEALILALDGELLVI